MGNLLIEEGFFKTNNYSEIAVEALMGSDSDVEMNEEEMDQQRARNKCHKRAGGAIPGIKPQY